MRCELIDNNTERQGEENFHKIRERSYLSNEL